LGTFNSQLNRRNLYRGDGFLKVLKFFELKMSDIDVLVINPGNEAIYLNGLFVLIFLSFYSIYDYST